MEPQLYRIVNSLFIDFNLLASKHPQLYEHLIILDFRTTINFKSQQSLIVLTEAIMKSIFSIQFHCPYQNLCPRVPNRLNYLLWVNKFAPLQIGHVLDVGTGATLIYPLLGYATFHWKFFATESNTQSVAHARWLIEANNLAHKIQVIQASLSNDMLDFCESPSPAILDLTQTIDVLICNPPFYDDYEEDSERGQTNYSPLGVMLSQEFSCSGGQYSFFFELYRQSFKHVSTSVNEYKHKQQQKIKIKYFTCLLGRLTSFKQVIQFLKTEDELGMLECFKLGQIKQGQNIRFVVLWRPRVISKQES